MIASAEKQRKSGPALKKPKEGSQTNDTQAGAAVKVAQPQ